MLQPCMTVVNMQLVVYERNSCEGIYGALRRLGYNVFLLELRVTISASAWSAITLQNISRRS